MSSTVISISGGYKEFDDGKKIFENIELNIDKGDYIVIMGESGIGKSTLMNILGTLDYLTSGTYKINGVEVDSRKDSKNCKIRNKHIGFMFQDYYLIDFLNVYENIELPLLYAKVSYETRQQIVDNLLLKFGIMHLKHRSVNNLSGGEKQRIAMCRAMILEPDILICDEPTGNLDEFNKKVIFAELKKLNDLGVTIIVVTHDKSFEQECNKLFEIDNRTIIELRNR